MFAVSRGRFVVGFQRKEMSDRLGVPGVLGAGGVQTPRRFAEQVAHDPLRDGVDNLPFRGGQATESPLSPSELCCEDRIGPGAKGDDYGRDTGAIAASVRVTVLVAHCVTEDRVSH